MAVVEINDQTLSIIVEGFDRVLAMRTHVTVPISHVVGVLARPDMATLLHMEAGTSLRGALLPGSLIIGTCPSLDGRGLVFCDVHDPTRAIVIELRHDSLQRILVEVSAESPEAVCERIEEACQAKH